MELIHWSRFGFIEEVRPITGSHSNGKPLGALWLSDESEDSDGETEGWQYWCRYEYGSEWFSDSVTAHKVSATEFILDDTALIIDNGLDFLKFSKTLPFREDIKYLNEFKLNSWIDWLKVDYPAVIITPYRWEFRLALHHGWYYGWDCASGPILDPSCIKEIIPRPDLKWFVKEDTELELIS